MVRFKRCAGLPDYDGSFCFNSTMVRFKRDSDSACEIEDEFQFHDGSIQARVKQSYQGL